MEKISEETRILLEKIENRTINLDELNKHHALLKECLEKFWLIGNISHVEGLGLSTIGGIKLKGAQIEHNRVK